MRPVAQHGIPRAGAHRPAGRRAHGGIYKRRQERPQRVLADDDIPIAQDGNLAVGRGQSAVQRHRFALPRIGHVPHGEISAAIFIHDGSRLGVRTDNQNLGIGRQLRQECIERPPDGRRLAIAGDDDADHRYAPDIENVPRISIGWTRIASPAISSSSVSAIHGAAALKTAPGPRLGAVPRWF